jgi:hypothetical protein
MWVIFLEAGVALALLLIIVWATWPRKSVHSEDETQRHE